MAESNRRWQGTSHYITDRGPTFVLLYGGIILCLLVIGISIIKEWLAYIPLAFAGVLLLSYFLTAAIWGAYQLSDRPGQRPVDVLLMMSQIKPGDKLACIDLGLRETAVTIAQRLTTGTLSVIDIYNPQENSSTALQRGRLRVRTHPPPADPRVEWLDGEIRLLPLPNDSVSAVFLDQILSEFWQTEDRQTLLREVVRVLEPGGRVLVVERERSRTNWLVFGPFAWGLATADHWRELLAKTGVVVSQEIDIQGLIHCFRADKPTLTGSLQLPLNLDLD